MKRVEAAPSEPIVKPSQSTPLPSFIPEGWTQTGGDWAELDPADYSKPKPPSLVDEDYLICRNVVIAFALKQKIWVKMVLFSHLREIPYNEDPFESLQFSPQRKLFIRRLVEGFKSGKENSYDDVIDDKGKGLIFLLYGPPGLGKTLTAESVAKVAQRPLYHVSAGELGTDVGSLERELLKIFQMGARWNAVVLLDEADVLMSKRTTDSLQRNSVVAVFLRMLEYYSGMLFLTTNRRDDFDDAFFNRIHVTIEYSELDDMSRANIWRHHLARATQGNTRPSTWTEDMYQQLGRLQLNGRNIKNYVRTAHAFTTAANGEDLTLKQVLIVLRNSLPGSSVSGSIGSNRQSDGRELLLQKLEELVI
ncbi:P-loop containing nucleoside triphosphate hydrolase protein [Stachybotrys elegans]|uniref:P-loop containing nucleoside triphosphate hydrolase protein n=1 Tax=Stachybotrys elegans TaxID=80388 RepID=A0A8K0WK61_9HYPO|nr:P-loop containing nucleoside triphosphate hydrolase protein [Stachybotrys elegans]